MILNLHNELLWGSSGRLPSAYQEVEWIYAQGGQSLNLSVPFSDMYYINYKISDVEKYSENTYLVDGIFGMNNGLGAIKIWYEYRTNQIIIIYANTSGTEITIARFPIADYSQIEIEQSPTFVKVNGTDVTLSTFPTWAGKNTLFPSVFALKVGNNQYTKFKLYYLKTLNSDNEKTMELVPCYRKSDDVIGMYDIVNDVFYTNQGTGTFTKGADVN